MRVHVRPPLARLFVLALVLLLPACAAQPAPAASPAASGCVPSDQDAYVYHPDRLQVQQPCVRLSGVIAEIKNEADGDLHLEVRLDSPYEQMLPQRYRRMPGFIVAEAVCYRMPLRLDPLGTCVADAHPFAGPVPKSGSHVWLEGRYVLDLNHDASPELHPLYRWEPYAP